MSKYRQAKRTLVLFVGFVAALCLVLVDAPALADKSQNSNDPIQNQNGNTGMEEGTRNVRRARRRARRRVRRARAAAAEGMTGTETTATDTNTNTSGGMTDDLSGTYTGTVNMPEHNASGPATLTVTGNSYTLEGAGMTHSGRFVANTTRGYTAVTMELGPTDAGQTPTFISVRARRLGGNGLSLMSVPGERRRFSFTTAGGGRRRGRRARATGADATTTDTSTTTTDTSGTDAAATDATGEAAPAATTGTRRRRGRARRGRRNARPAMENMNHNMGGNTNNNLNL